MTKYIVAVKINNEGVEVFEFPTEEKRKAFIEETRKGISADLEFITSEA